MNHASLHADSFAVDDAKVRETLVARRFEVCFDNGLDIPRRYGVQIKHVGNLEFDRFVVRLIHQMAASFHCPRRKYQTASAERDNSATATEAKTPGGPKFKI